MQLAREMRKRRLLLRARWVHRLRNQEADDITNVEFRRFKEENGIDVDVKKFGFDLMQSHFDSGDSYVAELEQARNLHKKKIRKASIEDVARERQDTKRRKPVRESDPWL